MPGVRIARSAALRRRYGVDCQFWRYNADGSDNPYTCVGTFRVLTKQVAINLTGAGFLPKTDGVRLADADSSQFDFTPTAFAPFTGEAAPQVGDRLICGGFLFQVTHVRDSGIGGDTETWLCYGFKVLL